MKSCQCRLKATTRGFLRACGLKAPSRMGPAKHPQGSDQISIGCLRSQELTHNFNSNCNSATFNARVACTVSTYAKCLMTIKFILSKRYVASLLEAQTYREHKSGLVVCQS